MTACVWTTEKDSLSNFAVWQNGTQSQGHIRPLHHHVACRLVLEGGFLPEEITPRPPFVATRRGSIWHLDYDESKAGTGELDVLGALKTKQVDVTVCKEGVGPVIAVSMKGTFGAFRNLTNRMEEAVGDCTNLHMAYPALVYGFLHVVRANIAGTPGIAANDIAINANGEVVESLRRYRDVLVRLAGRADIRDDVTRYESIALALIDCTDGNAGDVVDGFPFIDTNDLDLNIFFETLYSQYERRFIYAAPALASKTNRVEWTPSINLINDPRFSEFDPRLA